MELEKLKTVHVLYGHDHDRGKNGEIAFEADVIDQDPDGMWIEIEIHVSDDYHPVIIFWKDDAKELYFKYSEEAGSYKTSGLEAKRPYQVRRIGEY